ncbi:MAG: PaREP1 family protein, partial [Pyrobaculum sp.]
PEESSRERLKLAERYMEECQEYINKGDAVQASERAYKAAEEVVKALAERYRTPEYGRFLREGRWYTYLLSMASKTLAKNLGDWVQDGWNTPFLLSGRPGGHGARAGLSACPGGAARRIRAAPSTKHVGHNVASRCPRGRRGGRLQAHDRRNTPPIYELTIGVSQAAPNSPSLIPNF